MLVKNTNMGEGHFFPGVIEFIQSVDAGTFE